MPLSKITDDLMIPCWIRKIEKALHVHFILVKLNADMKGQLQVVIVKHGINRAIDFVDNLGSLIKC